LGALKEACDRGVVIVAISQCAKGTVSDAYEAGRTLLDTGVVAGGDMTPEVSGLLQSLPQRRSSSSQCALAKLSYLLSKPGLATANVRELIGAPIRGELTRRVDSVTAPADINRNVNNIQTLLAEVVRLSSDGLALASRNANAVASDHAADDAAAWSSTAGEAAATEAALYPFLVHSAAARNDASGIEFCVQAATAAAASSTPSGGRTIPGGIINCVDPTSGRSPLHTAALNGSTEAAATLLKAGALVHLRDTLGHTALYYVRANTLRDDDQWLIITAGRSQAPRFGCGPPSRGWCQPQRSRHGRRFRSAGRQKGEGREGRL
jgi:lysophospholipase